MKTETMREWELFISPRLVAMGLVFFGLVLFLASDYLAGPGESFKAVRLGLLAQIAAVTTWLLSGRWLKVARWFLTVMIVVIVLIGVFWLEPKVFLSLLVIPVAVAAILNGLIAAMVTAVIESIFLLIIPQLVLIEVDPGAVVMMLVAIWIMVGIMFVTYHPLQDITHWSWTNFSRARDLLEEVRDRKVELQQALDDLAHAYRELDLLNERVNVMRLAAEEAQAAKTAFVAKVSHEFRTPLNMIIGLTDVLMDTPEIYGEELSPPLREDLMIVQRNCEHLSKMVNDILDLSQTEAGRLTLHREWTNLGQEIESALTIVRPLLEKKGLTLQVVIPADLPQVYCDRTRISQVVLNLVSNAARFTDQGGVTVAAYRQEQYVVVNIIDTGPGVLPEDTQRIFEPFWQGKTNPWREQKGSGLGLSISKQFVEMHGGQMWLESPVSTSLPISDFGFSREVPEPKSEIGNPKSKIPVGGPGSTFSFKLPVSPPASPSPTAARWVNQEWVWHERISQAKLPQLPYKQRILICDDTTDLYQQLTHCSDEIEFIKTDSMEQAIHEAKTVPAHAVIANVAANPDSALLVEQARRELPDTPIITGSFPSYTHQVFEAGAVHYLIKPIMRADLEKTLTALDRPIRSVLIADDDPDLHRLLKRMLLMFNPTLKVTTVSSGEQALAHLRQSQPDLMLIDLTMPTIDGWQTLAQKKQDETIKDIPAIVISAQDPASRPLTSLTLAVTIGTGISVDKFLRSSLELSTLLLKPEGELDRAPQ